MGEVCTDSLVINKNKIKKPKQHSVYMLNDNVTTYDFVVHALCDVFKYNKQEAYKKACEIDKNGQSKVYSSSYNDCMTKKMMVESMARGSNFPLKLYVKED